MSDRFDEESAKIDASNLSGNAYVAALLRAAVRMAKEDRDAETMEGARAVEHVEVMAGAPVAGEWSGDALCLVDTGACVVNVYMCGDGTWSYRIYDADCDCTIRVMGGFVDAAEARGAAAAWARANPHLLDWQMPPVSVEDKARDYTNAEVERMASKWMEDDSFYDWHALGDLPRASRMESVRAVLRGDTSAVNDQFIAAVLAEKAKIDAERMPPASEPAPRETPAPSVSDHLLNALNLHRSKCGECSENVDGCETAQRIEAVMCEVNPSAHFTSESIADDKEQP